MADWHTTTSARQLWRDAPADATLQDLLDTAQHECLEYAPALPEKAVDDLTDGIPAGWRIAHLLQARAIWTYMQTTGPGGETAQVEGIGAPRIYPMDSNVKRRLRPDNAVPQVG